MNTVMEFKAGNIEFSIVPCGLKQETDSETKYQLLIKRRRYNGDHRWFATGYSGKSVLECRTWASDNRHRWM